MAKDRAPQMAAVARQLSALSMQKLAPVCRFDRELLFPLPNQVGREGILDIHTRAWTAPPAPALRAELAAMTVGYCGADLKVGSACLLAACGTAWW